MNRQETEDRINQIDRDIIRLNKEKKQLELEIVYSLTDVRIGDFLIKEDGTKFEVSFMWPDGEDNVNIYGVIPAVDGEAKRYHHDHMRLICNSKQLNKYTHVQNNAGSINE